MARGLGLYYCDLLESPRPLWRVRADRLGGALREVLEETSISMEAYTRVVLTLFVFACFQAWQGEHQSRIARESDLAGANQETSHELREKNEERKYKETCQGLLQTSQSRINDISGNVIAQQSQTQESQSKVQECLVELGKSQRQERLKITHYYLGRVSSQEFQSPPRAHYGTFLVLTNKAITPVRLLVTCESDISAAGGVLGTAAESYGGWGGQVTSSKKQFGVGILSPAWTPVNPLSVTVFSDSDTIGTCEFEEQ